MTKSRVQRIVNDIRYCDWTILVGDDYLQVSFIAPDCDTGEMAIQACRMWKWTSDMNETDIVNTAMKAVLAAVEHEAKENFFYQGKRVFNPHVSIDALLSIAGENA